MMSKHVMLDLETFGTDANAVIVSIGAVVFDFEKDDFTETWYSTVDARSCVDAGLVMTPETVMWWLKQSDEARSMFKETGRDLKSALSLFDSWIKEHDPAGVWGNGSDFDNVLIANACKAVGRPLPWKYYKNMCFRTMKNLFKVDVKREGTHHNAVDDAVYQMRVLKEINRVYALNLK
jgi:exodeoxyribonuclease VIII